MNEYSVLGRSEKAGSSNTLEVALSIFAGSAGYELHEYTISLATISGADCAFTVSVNGI
jgi:hypothetical protein